MVNMQRRNIIKQHILSHGSASAAELAKIFEVSGETIRRDLAQLENEGYVKRNYGGAVAVDELRRIIDGIPPVQQRKFENAGEKARIALAAANMVHEEMCVYLDAGSTSWSMLRFLNSAKLNVITNSLDIATECSLKEGWNIVVLGGQLSKKSMCMVGPEAEAHIHRINIDVAFLGSSGVSRLRGFSSSDIHEAQLKKKVLSKSYKTVVIADSAKIDRINLYTFATFDDVNCFITTIGGIDDDFRAKAEESDMELIET